MLTAHIRLEQKRSNNPYVHYPFVGNYQTKRGRQCAYPLFPGDASLSDWTRATLTNKASAEGAFAASQPLNNSSLGKLSLAGILHGLSWKTSLREIFRLWLLHVLPHPAGCGTRICVPEHLLPSLMWIHKYSRKWPIVSKCPQNFKKKPKTQNLKQPMFNIHVHQGDCLEIQPELAICFAPEVLAHFPQHLFCRSSLGACK